MTHMLEFSNEDILNITEFNISTRQALKTIIEKEGFKTYIANVKDISTNGGNYFGVLKTVTVKGISDDDEKELHLFLKNIVSFDDTNFVINVSGMHQREIFFYREINTLYEKIQDKYEILREERLNTVKVYGVTESGLIIMEDVSKAGYESFDRFDSVSFKFAKLSIEQLAKLHALSFVLQKEHPNYYEEKIRTMRSLFKFNVHYEAHYRRIFDKAMETLSSEAKSKLDAFYPKCIKKYQKYVAASMDESICLVHGDYRPNNILFRETDGEPLNVIAVDYQLMYFGSPVLDFLYFVFTGTDQEFRRNHLENLKDIYYTSFENFLSKFDIEAKNVYSRKQFEEEYKEKLDYGLMTFLVLMPFIFAKTDDVPDVENGLEEVTFNMEECYKERLHGVVDDFVHWGYL